MLVKTPDEYEQPQQKQQDTVFRADLGIFISVGLKEWKYSIKCKEENGKKILHCSWVSCSWNVFLYVVRHLNVVHNLVILKAPKYSAASSLYACLWS